MTQQRTHDNTPSLLHQKSIVLFFDGVTSPANIGGLFRLADAFGVKQIISNNPNVDLDSTRLKRTARSTERFITFSMVENTNAILTQLKKEGFYLAGLEITLDSEIIQKASHLATSKIVLVVGNEKHGISNSILPLLDNCYHIQMFGNNSSMNVTQATAIALYEITKIH